MTVEDVVKALEKQTPQRVQNHAKVALGSDFGTCPRCEDDVVEDYAFCPTCGQAIDWSSGEDD